MTDIYQEHTEPMKDDASGTVGVARDEAKNVAGQAVDSGKSVAATAKDEAAGVVGEAKAQVSTLFHQVTGELKDQAATQQSRAADGLRSIGGDLDDMASASSGGVAADLVSQASSRAKAWGSWLADRDPESLVDEVREFARRRPGTFIAIAAVAGLLAGRITRSAASNASAPDKTGTGASGSRVADVSSESPDIEVNTVDEPYLADAPAPATSTPLYSSLGGDDQVADPEGDLPVVGDADGYNTGVYNTGGYGSDDRDEGASDEFGAGNAQRPAGDDQGASEEFGVGNAQHPIGDDQR
ncbi:hypothetical protein E6C70_15125 [Glaciibacter flavus]|uniref:DUF3618 domain-containing protein n=1 Tax=Orlajensenia flava TaxID=2565934 RepID=A0A4S4FKG9_9MICO|nr:hypothetical protein [Glaciibacter flavus]THG30372.1 hypothetical protein E6C70_15125 [Glaciibacter flavus]